MTPADVRLRVKALCGVDSAVSHPRLTNTVIDDLLHEAMLIMAQAALPRYLRTKEAQNLVQDQASYFAPASFLEFIAVKSNGKVLRRCEQEDLDLISPAWESAASAATQSHYYVDTVWTTADANYGKLKFGIWPPASAAVSSALILRFIRKPYKVSEMTSVNVEIIDLPSWTHDALCQYVAWRYLAAQTERPREDYAGYRKFYDDTLALLIDAERNYHQFLTERGGVSDATQH